ncbi:metallopeptidase family protein [Sorangium sp. So ce1000]|uniref:metallopeptidase family protein n=1 Tax=Sorangium sp. So ce1000 TaxID=3133325 RepID=UPI003F605AA3
MPAPARRLLPAQVHLPSGGAVRLSDAAARACAPDIFGAPAGRGSGERAAIGTIGRCARDVQVLAGPSVLSDARGAPLDPLGLPLADAHVLRALLASAGITPEEPGAYTCENCGAPFEVAPSSLLESGPFTDGELDDPELDRPFDFGVSHPIPALRVGRAVCRGVRLVERTVEEAMPLLRLPDDGVLRITPSLVVAMGIAALGRERRAPVIADALASAPDDAWAAIVDLYHEARYPARLVAVHRCQGCGARNDLDVPLDRELARAPLRAAGVDGADADEPGEPRSTRARAGASSAFPDLDGFEARVRAAAERIYEARGVRNIDLFIDAGVPACDDGGEPLLGCYTPGTAEDALGIARPPEIRVFYRTFRAEAREDPGFDVDAEIAETIDHEVTHHLHHLAGSDPLDDEEHEEIAREQLRRVGHAEAVRRARRGALSDVAGFVRATWPAWVIVAVGTALAWCAGGR